MFCNVIILKNSLLTVNRINAQILLHIVFLLISQQDVQRLMCLSVEISSFWEQNPILQFFNLISGICERSKLQGDFEPMELKRLY